jgi:hypothetical protein
MLCDVCKWTETPFEPCPNAVEDVTAAVTAFWPIDLTVAGKQLVIEKCKVRFS